MQWHRCITSLVIIPNIRMSSDIIAAINSCTAHFSSPCSVQAHSHAKLRTIFKVFAPLAGAALDFFRAEPCIEVHILSAALVLFLERIVNSNAPQPITIQEEHKQVTAKLIQQPATAGRETWFPPLDRSQRRNAACDSLAGLVSHRL